MFRIIGLLCKKNLGNMTCLKYNKIVLRFVKVACKKTQIFFLPIVFNNGTNYAFQSKLFNLINF